MALEVKKDRGRPLGQSDDLTEEELVAIVQLPDKRTKRGLRDYAVLLTFANTPMRKGEVCALSLGDLVDEGVKKFITYNALKKRKRKNKETGAVELKQKRYGVKVPINPDVYDAILRYAESEHKGKKVDRSTPLFMTMGTRGPYKKARITPFTIDSIVAKYVADAGIKKRVTPHSFRASYVTLRSGSHDPETIRKIGGWADIRGVLPYFRSSQKKIEEAALSKRVI
jgi:integrase/recombinase XerD